MACGGGMTWADDLGHRAPPTRAPARATGGVIVLNRQAAENAYALLPVLAFLAA